MNFLNLVKTHKVISLISLIIIISLVVFLFISFSNKEKGTTYLTSDVSKQEFSISISGSSQISPLNQVDVSADVSGEVLAVYVNKGEEVLKGDVLAKIDSADYLSLVNETYIDYQNAKLELEELVLGADASDITQAENSLQSEKESLIKTKLEQEENYLSKEEEIENAGINLEESYEDAYNDISSVFLDFPGVITELNTLLFSYEISEEQDMFKQMNNSIFKSTFKNTNYSEQDRFNEILENAEIGYSSSKEKYDTSFDGYKDVSRYSQAEEIEELLDITIDAVRQTADTLKSATNMIDLWSESRSNNGLDVFESVDNYETSLKSSISKMNSHLTSLLSVSNNIKENKKDIVSLEKELVSINITYPIAISQLERSIAEKENSLANLIEGATDLEIKTQELVVSQKLNSYNEALIDYNNCKIIAPFDGIIAEINVSLNDDVQVGGSIFTFITDQKMVEIPLNEIDVVDVLVGQKALITFDAISDETFLGEVAEVDVLGTVEQGVVSYNTKIIFDSENELIKTGMTANVEIIIYENLEALVVPIGAVKTNRNGDDYVEILNNEGVLEQKIITIGRSNDTVAEILEGLSFGEKVVTGAGVVLTKTTTTNTTNGLLNSTMPQGGPMMR